MAEDGQKNLLRGSRNLAVSTLFCRILGFIREMLMASVLGGGLYMSAWVQALTLPNLFRRILGEGALGTALIPMIVHSMEQDGELRARERFSTIFLYLNILLCLITLVIALPAYFLGDMLPDGLWRLTAWLTPFVMPYCIFICSVGVLTCYANSMREYFLPSLAAILQNAVMIGALFLVTVHLYPERSILRLLALAIVLSGILELLLLLWIIKRKKMLPVWKKQVCCDMETIRSIVRLALPGIFAAAALQLSLVVDRLVAGWIGDHAPAALYFSERLVYLPIGIFAFAFGTVSLSEMSHAASKNDYKSLAGMYTFSLRNLLFVTIPIAVFMILFCEDLIRSVFMRGNFDLDDVRATAYAMFFYVPGIPLFAAYKVAVASFTARKDMITPFRVSLITVTLNIVLNFLLMGPLKQGGVALATVLTSLTGNLLLTWLLIRQLGTKDFQFAGLFLTIGKTLLGCLFAGAAARYAVTFLEDAQNSWQSIYRCGTGMIVFGFIFPGVTLLLRMPEARQFIVRIPGLRK